MHLKGQPRKLLYDQWQEILKKDKVVGIWECSKESEITGDKCAGWGAPKLKCSLSMPQAKLTLTLTLALALTLTLTLALTLTLTLSLTLTLTLSR